MGDLPNLYKKIGSLACQQLMEKENYGVTNQSCVIGQIYADLGLTSLAIAYVNKAKDKSKAFGYLGKLNDIDGNILKAFYYYIMASLLNGEDYSREMIRLSQASFNRNLAGPDIIACTLVSSAFLTNKKYTKFWSESLNRFKRIKDFGKNPGLIIETLCLLLVFIFKKTGIFHEELNELFISACKIIQKADQGSMEPALQLYSSVFPSKISSSTTIFRDSELNFLIDDTKAKTIVWTIIDAEVLVNDFEYVKQLIFYGQIKLLIPLAVVRCMDRNKFQRHRVKEVTTYLDDMLSHGSDAVRFQTVYETRSNRTAEDFFLFLNGVVEDYHMVFFEAMAYFSTQMGNCKYEIWSRNIEVIKRAFALGIPMAKVMSKAQ
jgi:hypothetical protein